MTPDNESIKQFSIRGFDPHLPISLFIANSGQPESNKWFCLHLDSDSTGMDRLLGDSRSGDVYPGVYVIGPKYAG